MPELGLLKHLLRKELYSLYFEMLPKKHLKDQFQELWYIYSALEELHSRADNDLTVEELKAYFHVKYPDADKSIYDGVFEQIEATNLSENVAQVLLREIKARQQALKLSEAAFKFSSGNGEIADIVMAYDDFDLSEGDTPKEDDFVSDDLEYLLEETVKKHGLRWRLDFLNKALGSLRKGDFGFLFARPETGKTTFLASEISAMLTQLKEDSGPIIWFSNEEAGNKVMIRMYQAYFGVRLDQLLASPRKYREEFNSQVRGRFKLVDNANTSKADVEKLLRQTNPSLIVYDQIDKIKGFAADREDLRLGAIYIWARELAKEYAPSIGVCQADGTAEGQKWLTMDNVANAKTSKQAEADFIIGVGATHSQETEFSRYLNISKNKLQGDSDSIGSLRHGRSEVLILPDIARYQDLVRYS